MESAAIVHGESHSGTSPFASPIWPAGWRPSIGGHPPPWDQAFDLFLHDQRIVLGDFKLALNLTPPRREEAGRDLPEEGAGKTPVYMAPEEFVQEGLECAVHVYSRHGPLRAVDRILPFSALLRRQHGRLKLTRRPIAPRRLNPEVPLGLEAVIRQATEGNPLLRYASAEVLAGPGRVLPARGALAPRRSRSRRQLLGARIAQERVPRSPADHASSPRGTSGSGGGARSAARVSFSRAMLSTEQCRKGEDPVDSS